MKKTIVVKVGSQNPAKVSAVVETLKDYTLFKNAKVIGVDVSNGISEQPMTLNETIRGAINRAKNSFFDCDYSIGLESGLMPIPETLSGFMNIGICAIYDGKRYYLGMAEGFEYPKIVIDKVLKDKIELSKAYRLLGLTNNIKQGATEQGIIGVLTKGRISRRLSTKHTIIMAMIQLENSELY